MTKRNPERAAAFEFARQLVDPQFREFLAEAGCGSEQDVVVAMDDTKVIDVMDRVFTRSKPPALIAIHRPTAPFGFLLMMIRPGVQSRGHDEHEDASDIDSNTSIGMLYDTVVARETLTYDVGHRWAYSFQPARPDLALA